MIILSTCEVGLLPLSITILSHNSIGLYTENFLENDSMRQLPLNASIEIDGKRIWTVKISRKKEDSDDYYPSL